MWTAMDSHQQPPPRRATGSEVRHHFATAASEVRQVWTGLRHAAVTIPTEVGRGLRWIDEHTNEITEFLDGSKKHRETAWRYLLDLVDPFTGMTAALALEAKERFDPRFEDAAAKVVEKAFQEPKLQADIRAAIEASSLPDAHRKQLIAGLAFVESQEHELAVPLLLIALEGAFWRLASERGEIERNRRGHWMTTKETDGKKHPIHAIEFLVKRTDLGLEPELIRFITILTYGGTGNDFRHGTAVDGWRLRSTFLTAALLGWLDAAGGLDARGAVRAAAARRRQERRSAVADDEQTA